MTPRAVAAAAAAAGRAPESRKKDGVKSSLGFTPAKGRDGPPARLQDKESRDRRRSRA